MSEADDAAEGAAGDCAAAEATSAGSPPPATPSSPEATPSSPAKATDAAHTPASSPTTKDASAAEPSTTTSAPALEVRASAALLVEVPQSGDDPLARVLSRPRPSGQLSLDGKLSDVLTSLRSDLAIRNPDVVEWGCRVLSDLARTSGMNRGRDG